MFDCEVAGCYWRLVVAFDCARRHVGADPVRRVPEKPGLAKNILSARLKAMVENGIMEIVPASDGSAYQEYVLTEKGWALLPVLVALGQWGADHLFCSGKLGFTPVDHRKKKPLKKLDLVSVEGKSIKPTEVLFPKTPSFTCKKRNLA